MTRLCSYVLMALLLASQAQAASNQQAATGNAAYARGAFEEAVAAYREGLLDQPDSLLLRFNLGTALYSLAKYDEAATAFTSVAAAGEEEWIARAAYNLGNTLYRLGEGNEAADPKAAVNSYQQALLVYRRAMAADAQDSDAKYGHEFVARKLEELLERQAEQEKQEQEQEQEPQQQQDDGDEGQQQEQEQKPDQDSADTEPPAAQDSGNDEQDAENSDAEQPQTEQPVPAEQGEQVPSEQEQQESLDRQAARAILDTASAEELGPEDISRTIGNAGEGRPAKDW